MKRGGIAVKTRNILKTIKGHETYDGAGVKLVRVLGYGDVKDIDPFLMLDAFDSEDPADYIKGFPLHPHRGIETFTYLIHGKMNHKDTIGNAGAIRAGEAQWMNSGSGIKHEEMPIPSDRLFGLQLWINLPKAHKMASPTYYDIHAEDMPTIKENGVSIRVVAGDYGKEKGPQGTFVKPLILDVSIASGKDFILSTPENDTLFIYILEGNGSFGDPPKEGTPRTAFIFDKGDQFKAHANEDVRFILFSGTPLHEPIAWAGPIVMNTKEELNMAFRELELGTFIKK